MAAFFSERTVRALRLGLAIGFPKHDKLGMEILEKIEVHREMGVENLLKNVIILFSMIESDPSHDPEGICIHHKDGPLRCIEDDGIRSLRAYAVDRQELLSEAFFFQSQEIPEVIVVFENGGGSQSKAFCFLAVISRRADSLLQSFSTLGNLSQVEKPFDFHVLYGLFHIPPGGLLGEDRPDKDLQCLPATSAGVRNAPSGSGKAS